MTDQGREEREKKILEFLEKGILLSPDVADDLDAMETPESGDVMVVDRENKAFLDRGVDWQRFDEAKVREEKTGDGREYAKMAELAKEGELDKERRGLKIIRNYTKKSKKYTYEDFVSHFLQRFKALSAILRQRQELAGATALSRVVKLPPRERASVIGMVKEKATTKHGNTIITIEDQTGELKLLVTTKKPELAAAARDVVFDEVLGAAGVLGDGILFVDALYTPDIPMTHETKKAPKEEYLAVIGDPQIGSKEFLKKDFEKMLSWLNGQTGSEEQRRIASLVTYVVVNGDLVEGVGVYPGQENDLEIKDIKEQYAAFAAYLRRIPSQIQIIIIPGNHDAGRIAEPQPAIYKDYAPDLYAMENVTLLSSPSTLMVAVDLAAGFPGLELLLYHGYSLPYYADNVPSIRERGGQKRSELIMKFLLQRRHLAPSHTSNTYVPDPEEDPLTIERVPDLFITGHIHRVASASYRGVTMVNASTWGDITEDQEKRGLEPQPARLPLINLQTRDVKIINFYSGTGKAQQRGVKP